MAIQQTADAIEEANQRAESMAAERAKSSSRGDRKCKRRKELVGLVSVSSRLADDLNLSSRELPCRV